MIPFSGDIFIPLIAYLSANSDGFALPRVLLKGRVDVVHIARGRVGGVYGEVLLLAVAEAGLPLGQLAGIAIEGNWATGMAQHVLRRWTLEALCLGKAEGMLGC